MHGWNIVEPSGSQAVKGENKQQPSESGKTDLLEAKNEEAGADN